MIRPRSLKAQFLVEHVDLEAATGFPQPVWEDFQIQFFNNQTRFAADAKARQIGWSWVAAADAIADGILNPDTPHVFVSINLDEAKEKIRYARMIHAALRPDVQATFPLKRVTLTELELANGSRLISHPCRPPRGKPRARIYLDEMAHYPDYLAREVYKAALPATTKGDGYIRLGSSPMGARGMFWEIMTETLRKYPGYAGQRRFVPWWYVRALCRDVNAASEQAPAMLTAERVYAFGTPALIEIFENMFLEDFQQEYECAWVDELSAWISWEVIQRNQDPGLLWWHATDTAEALQMLAEVERAIDEGQIEGALVGGVDVGRKRDLTELILLGRSPAGRLPLRLMVSLDRVKFDAQEACLRQIFNRLPITQVLIDQNGIGMQLAENLHVPGKIMGVDFTNPSKELWAVEARVQAERGAVPIPMDRDLAYQIHAIKKTVTAAKHNVFDTEGNEKHHSDKFWAWALGIWAGNLADKREERQGRRRGSEAPAHGEKRYRSLRGRL